MKHLAALALLLPVCLCAQRVVPVGDGIVGSTVNAMIVFNGKLIIGGAYSSFNGHTRNNLVGWDGGTQFDDMGDAFDQPNEPVLSLTIYQGDLIAGGRELTLNGIARWDGTSWNALGTGLNNTVFCTKVWNGELYAGGNFTMSGGNMMNGIAKWDGTNWVQLGAGLNAQVYALEVYDGALYAGGYFTADGNNSGTLNYIAKWNGATWEAVANGLNGTVCALLDHNGVLWIGGSFSNNIDSTLQVSRLTTFAGGAFVDPPLSPIGSVYGLSDLPTGELLVGSIGSSILADSQGIHHFAFSQGSGLAQFTGRFILAGTGGSQSYDQVKGVGELLAGLESDTLTASNAAVTQYPSPWSFSIQNGYHAGFEIPQHTGRNTIYAMNPWLTGRSTDSLFAATSLYFIGAHHSAGPNATLIDKTFLDRYYQVWRIDRGMIDHHLAHYQDAGYVVPYTIATWPGNGDVGNGEPPLLAPFSDVNHDGLYEPEQGEYPLIRGDEAIYTILHDEHDSTGYAGSAMKVDIHLMQYAFDDSWDPFLFNTVFTNIKYINRSTLTYDSVRFGMFADPDIGCDHNDYMGCDTILSVFFGYNGDSTDLDCNGVVGYQAHPPAEGIAFLNEPMTAFRSMGSSPDPYVPLHFERLLEGMLLTGDPVLDPLGHPTPFQYHGDPNDPSAWNETMVGNPPGDRRGVGATGPFTFAPGDTLCFDLAEVFAQDTNGTNLTSVTLLKQRVQQLRDWYATQSVQCNASYDLMTYVPQRTIVADELRLFPNPATDMITLQRGANGESARVQLISATGRIIITQTWPLHAETMHLSTSNIAPGLYLIRVEIPSSGRSMRFVKSGP